MANMVHNIPFSNPSVCTSPSTVYIPSVITDFKDLDLGLGPYWVRAGC